MAYAIEPQTAMVFVLPASERQSVSRLFVSSGMAITGADRIGGTELRHAISVCLLDAASPLSLAEVVAGVEALHCPVPGRASKTVSDALRWEVRKGRAVRLGRSSYRAGTMPRSTEWWIRRQVASRQQIVAQTPAEAEVNPPPTARRGPIKCARSRSCR